MWRKTGILAGLLSFSAAPAGAEPLNELVRWQWERLDTTGLEQTWQALLRDYGPYLSEVRAPSLLDVLRQDGGLQVTGVLKGLATYFLHEVLASGRLLGTIVILTVFSMLLETLQNAFERNTVSKVAYAIAYMVLIGVAVGSFHLAVGYAREAIERMVHFMLALIPLVLTLLAAMGHVVSVSMFHPLIVFLVNVSGTLIAQIVFPLLFFSAVLSIVSSFSDRYKVTQLANLLRTISLGALGVFLTVFLGVVSIQGATSAVADGVALRTAKFLTSQFVPVVGRMFSDATDTVIGASLLVKNAIGLAGVVILLFLCAFPAIKILTLAFIYNLSAAVLQPLGSSPIIGCLGTIGKNLLFVFAALATVGLMFFLSITILIAAGNAAVMLR
ncbi:stage III sporulation protein AE [Calditerricola satsumensis]|uniref:Stage III sporulation protein AE n=1 Tax=Calditerricola satsumensis TaxID=373054 RepID=A0A8J3FB10_9BACI|nr:stage III sporulation protein AE [Calditerricola satsumensis]